MPVNGELDYNVGFVEALLDEAVKQYPIDENRIFAAGWSSGGQQTLRLACLASDRFQAFSVVAQTLEFDTREACAAANYTRRPMQFIIGDSDPKNPPGGRGPEESGASPGRTGIQETIDFFVEKNECKANVKPEKLRDAKVMERRYNACKHGDIRWLVVEGGTHAWPGGPEGVKDLSASEESVAFFREHGL
jgi:polyhydroxybutyrate depolymerase